MADGKSKKTSGTCAHCQKPTTSTCGGCREAPLYDEDFIESTFYCNSKCLKAGWAQHRSKCRKLQARKSLARAAMLLQAIIYLFRLHASTLRFKSLRLEGSTIFLDGFQFAESQSHESEQALKPFPVPFNGDENLAEAVLVYTGSVEAMMYLHSFADELLDELSSRIEDSTVTVTDRKLQICPVFPDGQWKASSDPLWHDLYKVTLKNGEVWAVDTTGAQHGYPGPLCPWPGIEQRRSYKVEKDSVFGTVQYEAFNALMILPRRHIVAQMTERQELCDAIEKRIPALAQACGGKLSTILRGSDATFKEAKDKFLDQLDDHLAASMIKLYTPGQIARRNKRVDSQFSKNKGTSNKRTDAILRFIASASGSRGNFW